MRVVSLALVTLVACSPSPDPAQGSGGDALEVTCPDGQAMDDLGICRITCAVDGDCAAAEACEPNLGFCVPDALVPCDPLSCPEGFVCPAVGHDCVAVEVEDTGCVADAECALGERCDAGECVSRLGDVVMTCETSADCGLLMMCQVGICLGCLDDLQCGTGGTCVLGACVVADLGPAGECLSLTCADGERCNPLTGTCAPICAGDTECGEGQACAPILDQCIAEFGCASDADCLTNFPLCVEGLCVGCQSDAECLPSEKCLGSGVASVCLPTFESLSPCDSVTCDSSETCDPQDGSCYPSNGTCAASADCRDGQTCNFLGFCTGCSADGDCRSGQRCLFGTCIPLE